MPTYCYTTDDGTTVERVFKRENVRKRIQLPDGRWAYRDYAAEHVGVPPTKGWPMEPCWASGVHASQAQELRDHYKKHGLNVRVTDGGDPIYESSAQRKKALECRGMVDRSSF